MDGFLCAEEISRFVIARSPWTTSFLRMLGSSNDFRGLDCQKGIPRFDVSPVLATFNHLTACCTFGRVVDTRHEVNDPFRFAPSNHSGCLIRKRAKKPRLQTTASAPYTSVSRTVYVTGSLIELSLPSQKFAHPSLFRRRAVSANLIQRSASMKRLLPR